jgi:hypothetical protein
MQVKLLAMKYPLPFRKNGIAFPPLVQELKGIFATSRTDMATNQ